MSIRTAGVILTAALFVGWLGDWTMTFIAQLEHRVQEERDARLAAESKIQTVHEFVREGMKNKQTRAIMCAR